MDAIAIQDANKIRVAMGLAPLPVPGEDASLAFKTTNDDGDDSDPNDTISTLEKRSAAAGDNWKKLQDEQAAKDERQRRKEAAKKARDAAQRFAVLEGKGLGDADANDVDTKTWLLQQKKRQKKIDKARKYEEEQLERERAAQAEYTAKDLAGVKVGHTLDEFDEGGEQVLTLKDTEIAAGDGDDQDDDELENLDLRDKERLKEKLELLKKKPVYNPNDDDSANKSILAHYDDEIDGKKKHAFTLDGQGTVAKAAIQARDADANADRSKGIKISLDILQDDTPVSDYQDPSTLKLRKPKKPKKPKTSRQKAVDDDDVFPTPAAPATVVVEDGSMHLDNPQAANTNDRKRPLEFDDDDLQAKLAEQRRLALKKRKKMDAAELARRIREEESTPVDMDEDGDEPGMVIDETTEFVSNLKRHTSPDEDDDDRRRRHTSTPAAAAQPASPDADVDGDTAMAESYGAIGADDDDADAHASSSSTAQVPVTTSTGFEEEEQMNQGIGASLAMLRKRGLVSDSTAAGEQNAIDRARDQFRAENRNIINDYDRRSKEDREAIRQNGKWSRMSRAEQEAYNRQANERREAFLAQLQAEHFRRSYKPDVKLRYNDEFGREMNAKEAFKHLSHQFHGKGSGKQKTEKRLKKIEDERKREAMSSLDSSQAGMNNAVGAQARKNRQAGVRLQ